jgi:cobyrinic acid a,c-diamide synthase
VILLVDATKMTRTAAALVVGCRALDPELALRGVILNRVAGERHENVLRESIENSTGIPVFGSVRKLGLENLPQRHLGLLPWHEHPRALAFVDSAARIVEESADLPRILEVARAAPVFSDTVGEDLYEDLEGTAHSQLCIGVLRDSAFQFYYPENLEALGKTGARIMEISALDEHELPLIDALYVGGGFPETHASKLAENHQFRESLWNAVQAGLPVYAECGGLLYLSRNLVVDANVYPMAGVLPVETILKRKPQGHGYVRAEVCAANPFYPVGTQLTGHEFHYSSVSGLDRADIRCALRVTRGQGIDGERDGICTGNVLATYLHVHALGTPQWADGILRKAQEFQGAREQRGLSKL